MMTEQKNPAARAAQTTVSEYVRGRAMEAKMDIRETLTGRVIGTWDGHSVRELRRILDDLEAGEHRPAMDRLPTVREIPDDVCGYPVWAVDRAGLALTGADARNFEPLADVIAYYAQL